MAWVDCWLVVDLYHFGRDTLGNRFCLLTEKDSQEIRASDLNLFITWTSLLVLWGGSDFSQLTLHAAETTPVQVK